jgi:hypothetical protein
MKHSWFHHPECTTQQADELVARYRQRGVKVERSLNPDFVTWTVSAQLVEDKIRRGQTLAGVTGCGGDYGEPTQSGAWPRMYRADPRALQRQPGNQRAGTLPTGRDVRYWMQADDTQAAIACNGCHDVIDGRAKTTDFTYDELRLMHAEGVMRTLEIWRKEDLSNHENLRYHANRQTQDDQS